MSEDKQFDFWYAVNNTKLIKSPSAQLETFGDTIVNYTLICEQMDDTNKICVREGQMKALKPTIITPDVLGEVNLENFGSDAKEYADWLKENANELRILQYGFSLHKQEIKQYIITDKLDNVVERVKKEASDKNDPLGSILIGVDVPWEVCLLKLMVELVQESAHGNIEQIQKNTINQKKRFYEKIDHAFVAASRDPSQINSLADMLKRKGLWEQYEDRFFALIRSSKNNGG